MKWLLVFSFFLVIDVRHSVGLVRAVNAGCEVFTVWENAQQVPRYWFLHCPDESLPAVQDGVGAIVR